MSYFVPRRSFWRPDQPQAVYTAALTVTPPTVPQTWPALLEAVAPSYRSGERRTLDVRSFDVPQSVYKGALGLKLWEAPIYASISDAERNVSPRADARPGLDVRDFEWSPAFSWVRPIVDATVAKWTPVFRTEASSERSQPGLPFDIVRLDSDPEFGWVRPVVDQTVSKWATIWASQFAGERSRGLASIDLATMDSDPQDGWKFTNLAQSATVAQTWPSVLQALGPSYRSDARPSTDVRDFEWSPEFGWIARAVDTVVSAWSSVFTAQRASARSQDDPTLDVRWQDWSPQPAWILSGIAPPPSTAQTWPAVLSGLGLSYRSGDRCALDVRGYEWSPEFGWVPKIVDGVVATWSPVFSTESNSVKSADRARLDVRVVPWSPDASPWILTVLTPSTSTAQQWPSILQALGLSYRSGARPGLEVRAYDWAPSDAWRPTILGPIVAQWSAIFASELASGMRSRDGQRLAVHAITLDVQLAWFAGAIVLVPPPVVVYPQTLKAMNQALLAAGPATEFFGTSGPGNEDVKP